MAIETVDQASARMMTGVSSFVDTLRGKLARLMGSSQRFGSVITIFRLEAPLDLERHIRQLDQELEVAAQTIVAEATEYVRLHGNQPVPDLSRDESFAQMRIVTVNALHNYHRAILGQFERVLRDKSFASLLGVNSLNRDDLVSFQPRILDSAGRSYVGIDMIRRLIRWYLLTLYNEIVLVNIARTNESFGVWSGDYSERAYVVPVDEYQERKDELFHPNSNKVIGYVSP